MWLQAEYENFFINIKQKLTKKEEQFHKTIFRCCVNFRIDFVVHFSALDEDRYGMPRRRRASPEWQRGRLDDRDSSLGGHR